MEVQIGMNEDDHRDRPFDLLEELGRFCSENNISLSDPQLLPRFLDFIEGAVDRALDIPTLVYGLRTQAMFEAMLISLGDYLLFKPEDSGRVHPEESFKVPDFRVVLKDGTQWLIEVKNVHIENTDPSRQERLVMKREYHEKLENYASATGAQLKLAVYWSKWRLWTLVSPDRLVDRDENLMLDMQTALERNELVRLGDRMIGTRPPIRIRCIADPTKPSGIASDGTAQFTIGDVQVCCDESVIVDANERDFAFTIIAYGQWQESGPHPLMEGRTLKGVEFRWEPISPANQGFEIVGMLSQLFANYYNDQTAQDGDVTQIHALPQPEWSETLIDYDGKALPLWRFSLEPKSSEPQESDEPSEV